MNNFVGKAEKLIQPPCGHAQTRRRRRREMVTTASTARTRRCTENSQIPGERKPNGTGRGFLQGHTRGAITPAPFVQTTSGCRATVPRTQRPGCPPPLVRDQPHTAHVRVRQPSPHALSPTTAPPGTLPPHISFIIRCLFARGPASSSSSADALMQPQPPRAGAEVDLDKQCGTTDE